MNRSVFETIMGAVVLGVAALFMFFVFASSDLRPKDGYAISAKFNRVDGLATGSDVRMSGIKIGSVTGQDLDPKTYLATVHLSIANAVHLPSDTTARILTDGLLGANYLSLEPGGADDMIPPGGVIQYTQDPLNIVDLVGKLMFSPSAKPGGQQGGQQGAPATGGAAAPATTGTSTGSTSQ